MIETRSDLKLEDLMSSITRLWELSAAKIDSLEKTCSPEKSSPVFTVEGRYRARGWTEWTRGFQYGSAILQFDATGEERFLDMGRRLTREAMASHVTHMGVHDHGFNNVSTYGNLWRLMMEGKIPDNLWESAFYRMALKCSGAVQARRWSKVSTGGGFIYSFNGPHSLFADTIRSLRSLALAHELGHVLLDERDQAISLLQRLVEHARATAEYTVYYGKGRDRYDVRGRVAHESLFDPIDGSYRCASTQQGHSPFSTWTRGLAWIMCGFAEQLECLATFFDEELEPLGGRVQIENMMLEAARATCDFYISETPTDGIPYWDTGAPGLLAMEDYLVRPADPFNDHEPVDSSAAAIAAQGLLRLGHFLRERRDPSFERYWQAGLTVVSTLLDEPYISADPEHQGLLLHSIYHRPNGWDHVPPGRKVPCGESSMWGDYHIREVALYLQRLVKGETYYTFFGPR